MAWARVDDNLPHHPKFLRVSPEAAWFWICALCYTKRHLTDGFIPRAALPLLGAGFKRPERLANELAAVKLFDEVDGGYAVHGFLELNDSRAQVEAKLEVDRARKNRSGAPRREAESERNPTGIPTESRRNPESRARAGAGSDRIGSGSEDLSASPKPDASRAASFVARFGEAITARGGKLPLGISPKDWLKAELLTASYDDPTLDGALELYLTSPKLEGDSWTIPFFAQKAADLVRWRSRHPGVPYGATNGAPAEVMRPHAPTVAELRRRREEAS